MPAPFPVLLNRGSLEDNLEKFLSTPKRQYIAEQQRVEQYVRQIQHEQWVSERVAREMVQEFDRVMGLPEAESFDEWENLWAQRLRQAAGGSELEAPLEVLESFEALQVEVGNLRRELSETQERLDRRTAVQEAETCRVSPECEGPKQPDVADRAA